MKQILRISPHKTSGVGYYLLQFLKHLGLFLTTRSGFELLRQGLWSRPEQSHNRHSTDQPINPPPLRKVMQVTWSFMVGGSELYALTIARGLAPERYRSLMCAMDRGGDLEPEIRQSGIPTFVMNRRPGIDWKMFWQMYRLFRNERIDLVQTHHFTQLLYSAPGAILTGARLIHTEHSTEVYDRLRRRLALRLLTFFCNRLVTVGSECDHFFRYQVGIPARKLVIIRPGVDLQSFAPVADEERAAIRHQLGLTAEDRVALMVARLAPEKNHRLLLQAFASVVQQIPQARLLIAGEGTEQEVIRAQIQQLRLNDCVRMLGNRRDVAELLAAADVFVLSSDREGLPIALLEAMAAERPVVATAVGDIPHVIQDGETGRLVPPGDAEALAAALTELLGNESTSAALSQRAAATVRQSHSVETMQQQWRQLFDRLSPADLNSNQIDESAKRLCNVLFVAWHFPPDTGMGAQTCGQIAKYLPQHGWRPIILTAHEKFIEPGFRAAEPQQPLALKIIRTGRLPHPIYFYRGLKRWMQRRSNQSDEQAAIHQASFEEKGWLRNLLLSALSTPDIQTGWILPAVLAGWKVIRQEKVKHIVTSGALGTTHLTGYLLSRLTGLPLTLHLHDPWSTYGETRRPERYLWHSLNAALERRAFTHASRIVCVTETHAELLQNTWTELPADKFITIPNGYDEDEWKDLIVSSTASDNRTKQFLIVYAGQLYMSRNPLPLFRALKALIDTGVITREHLRVELLGQCETSEGRSVRQMIAENELTDCVILCGSQDRRHTLQRLTQADLLLLLAEDLTLQIPGKTYEYLRAGRPILALTEKGAVARLLQQTGGGWVVDPKDESTLQKVLRERYRQWLADEPGPVADPITLKEYDRQRLTEKLARLFESQPDR